MEDFIEKCVAYLEGHTWHIACLLGLLPIFRAYPWRAHLWKTLIAIFLFHGVLAWSKP
jgi:hypothetical protein